MLSIQTDDVVLRGKKFYFEEEEDVTVLLYMNSVYILNAILFQYNVVLFPRRE